MSGFNKPQILIYYYYYFKDDIINTSIYIYIYLKNIYVCVCMCSLRGCGQLEKCRFQQTKVPLLNSKDEINYNL